MDAWASLSGLPEEVESPRRAATQPSRALYFVVRAMKTTIIYTTLAVIAAACSAGRPAAAQMPVTWTIAPLRATPGNGATVPVRIDARIQQGWHIYSITQPAGGPIATRITVPPGQVVVAAGAATPTVQPRIAYDDAFKMNVQLHEKAVGFNVPVRSSRLASATDSVHVNVRYQVCNASLCYPPQTARLATPLFVAGK
jgi:DsbC/DsbD-like thiol-disulfide interchange protein